MGSHSLSRVRRACTRRESWHEFPEPKQDDEDTWRDSLVWGVREEVIRGRNLCFVGWKEWWKMVYIQEIEHISKYSKDNWSFSLSEE